MTSSANGWAYSPMNSQLPRPANSSITWSASRHMKASFSFSRLGVSMRIISPRCAACSGGSMVPTRS